MAGWAGQCAWMVPGSWHACWRRRLPAIIHRLVCGSCRAVAASGSASECTRVPRLGPGCAEFAEVALDSFDMEVDMTVEQVAGWVQSWSAFKPYCQQHGEEATRELLERYCQDLVAALGVPDAAATVRTRWPLHLLLARQPVPVAPGERAAEVQQG